MQAIANDAAAGLRLGTHASTILRAAVADSPGETVTLASLITELRGRAYGFLFVVLALGNIVPGPPGIGGIFGVPMLFFAAQAAMGLRVPIVPKPLDRAGLPRTRVLAALDHVTPLLEMIEARFRPRLEYLARGPWERLAAIVIGVLAVAMSLPVPLTNFLPAAAALIIALGILQRDGLAVVLGLGFATAAITVVGIAASVIVVSIGHVAARFLF